MTRKCLVTAVCLMGMVGCGGSDSDDDDSNGNGIIGDGNGELSLWITDAPARDVDAVEITITGVAIKPSDGDAMEVILDQPLLVDLLDLVDETDMREEILDDHLLPVGEYDWIRLLLDETRLFIEVAGFQHLLVIPEEEVEGLQLPFNVAVDDDTDLDLTIDFDVRKSLRNLGDNNFELHPTLRIVRTEQTGTLSGTVSEDLIRDPACDDDLISDDEGNAVYVFSGVANFQDLQGNQGDPLVTAPVELERTTGDFEFTAGFLPRGNYTVFFTCDGAVDDPEVDNSLGMQFSAALDADIVAGETTEIEFE